MTQGNHSLRLLPIAAFAVLAACTSQKKTVAIENPEAALAQHGADAVIWQNTSAEAQWLYHQSYEHAYLKLEANLARMEGAGPRAVVVDIDETVLDNSPYQVAAIKRDRTFDQAAWREWTDKAEAKASPGALEFLRHAAERAGCEVFYITNRDIRERASTLKNLQDLGFPNADEAHLLLMDGNSDKTERRARVRATHRIALLVGDQLRDFDERFKDRSANNGWDQLTSLQDSLSRYFILLPNPMYGTWRDAIHGKGSDAEKLARAKAWFELHGY